MMPRVGAVVGVKDEEELIGACLAHLRAIGVTEIVVEDYGSTDDTLDIVAAFDPPVTIVHFDESVDMGFEAWGRHEAELVRRVDADWVLLLDADEFWLPPTGDVAKVLQTVEADAITVPRFNVVLAQSGPLIPHRITPSAYDEILMYTRSEGDFSRLLERDQTVRWIQGVPQPKIALRPTKAGGIAAGHHSAVDRAGREFGARLAEEMLIAHLPFTSLSRFERKVRNIRQTVSLQPSYHTGMRGWHWKRWIRLADEGQLEREYRKQIAAPDDLKQLRSRGIVQSAEQLLNRGTRI